MVTSLHRFPYASTSCPVEPSLVQALIHRQVQDTRPPSARANLTNVADVPKYVMPAETYSTLPDSVLAWKKANKLGRFDPHAPEIEKKKIDEGWTEMEARGMIFPIVEQALSNLESQEASTY